MAQSNDNTVNLSELQKAGLTIKKLKEKLSAFEQADHEPIAIIGIGCRFPGNVYDTESYWKLLEHGTNAVLDVNLRRINIDDVFDDEPGKPGYIYSRSGGYLNDIESFDAEFFGITPKEAVSLDPQQRLLLETSWEALENAGEIPGRMSSLNVGVYVGITAPDYAQYTVQTGNHELFNGYYLTGVTLNGAAGRIAYTFGFNGPCLAVDTACSSSLSAVHLAVKSLRSGECSIALAAGVNILLFTGTTISMCEAGMISKSGLCRSFDKNADGLIRGEGCGVVILKRLKDAIRDKNAIWAVIKGTAMNQDGASSSITAPNGEAQKSLIVNALKNAGLTPEDIDYIEAHGSATPLGDQIELNSIIEIFKQHKVKDRPLYIGSVKTNLGHLESASGMASLIKVCLALKKKKIPAHLHLQEPHEAVVNNPVQIPTLLTEWNSTYDKPRRAGINAFGASGTNVHLVMEEFESFDCENRESVSQYIFISAKSLRSLELQKKKIAEYMTVNTQADLNDIAYTLQKSRGEFNFRAALTAKTKQEAAKHLNENLLLQQKSFSSKDTSTVFLFPGIGDQYNEMAVGLYEKEPAFRNAFDECHNILLDYNINVKKLLSTVKKTIQDDNDGSVIKNIDFRSMLTDHNENVDEPSSELHKTINAHPVLFTVEYALVKLWESYGIEPSVLVGYSVGEYVAACCASVFTLREALFIVSQRASLLSSLPGGMMVAVTESSDTIKKILVKETWIAAENTPSMCVVSGKDEAIDELCIELKKSEILFRKIKVNHAFHCPLVNSIKDDFILLFKNVTLRKPSLPIISNVTGKRLTDSNAVDPLYWYSHMSQTVQFSTCMESVLNIPGRIFIEAGPGNTLSSFIVQHPESERSIAVSSLPTKYEIYDNHVFFQNSVSRYWVNGGKINWTEFQKGQNGRHIHMPGTEFVRNRFWFKETNEPNKYLEKKNNSDKWIYLPIWKSAPIVSCEQAVNNQNRLQIVFGSDSILDKNVIELYIRSGVQTVVVNKNNEYQKKGDWIYTINPLIKEDFSVLLQDIDFSRYDTVRCIYLWSIVLPGEQNDELTIEDYINKAYYSPLFLLQAFAELQKQMPIEVTFVTNNVQTIFGCEIEFPEVSVINGPAKVIRQECPTIAANVIDIAMSYDNFDIESENIFNVARLLVKHTEDNIPGLSYSLRGANRWVQTYEHYEPKSLPESGELPIKNNGVYLITGGLGGIGLAMAEYCSRKNGVTVILVNRSDLPPRSEWNELKYSRSNDDIVKQKIEKIEKIESTGTRVRILKVNISFGDEMRELKKIIDEEYGKLNGVFHTAGVPGSGLIQLKTREMSNLVFAPKISGTIRLVDIFKDQKLDFMLFFSSTMAIYGGIGQVDYCAANSFLDSYAQHCRENLNIPVISINWDMWKWDNWQNDKAGMPEKIIQFFSERRKKYGISFENSTNVLDKVLKINVPQLAVSPLDLLSAIEEHTKNNLESISRELVVDVDEGGRPCVSKEYQDAETEVEKQIVEIWKNAFGYGKIGVNDNFFELGGHSLIALKITAGIKSLYETEMSVKDVLSFPTIRELSAIIEEKILEAVELLTDVDVQLLSKEN